MSHRLTVLATAAAALFWLAAGSALAFDESKYPDWPGYYTRVGPATWDPTKPAGLGQQAPLTPEYQAILEASIADQAAGGQGNNPMGRCIPPGLPRTMINYLGMEIVIQPNVTYFLLLEPSDQIRRVFTDGRKWPDYIIPSYIGYSIGTWLDRDGDGRFDTLEVETRGLKPLRVYDGTGIPFHKDGETVIKERITLDPADRNILTNEFTVIDHALTRPWTVTRKYRRDPKAIWVETACGEENHQIRLGGQDYFIGADDNLMPSRKGQKPPDLQHFK
jgi:hypothetical protein